MTASPHYDNTVYRAFDGQWIKTEASEYNNYSSHNLPTDGSLDTIKNEPLSTYDRISEQENDDLSDDTCSVAGSIFSHSSEASSQSSYSAVTSEDSDDPFDRHDASNTKLSDDNTFAKQHLEKRTCDHESVLAGLQTYFSGPNNRPQEHLSGHKLRQPIPRSQPTILQPKISHRRRSGSCASANGPPSLKRDTDQSDCFVAFLITFAARLITAIWPLSGTPPMMSSCFNGAGVLPLATFVHETLRRSKTSYSTLQVALFYMILLKGKLSDRDFTKEQCKSENSQRSGASTCRAMQCGRRMFLASLMLASKYLQDRNYSTRAWSKISGLRIPEINENETEYLSCIDYRLHMKKEAFENWSKIVISLSKLSKSRACSVSYLASLRKDALEGDAVPASFIPSTNLVPDVDDFDIFSNQWWSQLVKNIQPDLVDDGSITDAFVQDLAPLVESAELLARSGVGLPTPPASPEALPATSPCNVPDMPLSHNLPYRNGSTSSFSTLMALRAPSPVRSSRLPLRPQLPNLPTPHSTPGGTDVWRTLTHRNQPQSLRCSVSADALRSMHRLEIMTANLDRCPPPRPQSHALPSVRSLVRPAESIQACYSGATTPSAFSPASSTSSGSAPRTSRSRSSSISSHSSFSSWASGLPREVQTQIQSPNSGFPAPTEIERLEPQPKQTSPGPEQSSRSRNNFASTASSEASTEVSTAKPQFEDPGYFSDEDRRMKEAALEEAAAAEALLAIGGAGAYYHEPKARSTSIRSMPSSQGHKRTFSKTDESLQDCVRQSLLDQPYGDQVMQDAVTPKPFCSNTYPSKQVQAPSKLWAGRKMPVPNSTDRKRIAVSCRTRELSAAERASQSLKRELLEHEMSQFVPSLPSVTF